MNELNGWSTDIPTEAGNYWFYGNPYKGQMGSDYKKNPDRVKLYYVEVQVNFKNTLIITEGQIVSARKFDASRNANGVVGYFKKVEPVEVPLDDPLNIFIK